MPDLLNRNSVPLRVLREHFGLPREADALTIIEAVARKWGILCTEYIDECALFGLDQKLPKFVQDYCDEILRREQERIRSQNGD